MNKKLALNMSGMTSHLFTSESVSPGHPDKICDQISDAIVDAALEQDAHSRVAVETGVKGGVHDDKMFAPLEAKFGAEAARQIKDHGAVVLLGELTTTAAFDPIKLTKDVIKEIGYRDGDGFDPDCFVMPLIGRQSPDIARGVNKGDLDLQGAGDQGLMFGYATDETPAFMPLPIYLANGLIRRLVEVRENGTLPWLRPDAKSQVTVMYENDVPKAVAHVVVAAQHTDSVSDEAIRKGIMEEVIKKVIPEQYLKNTIYHINGTGRFVIGGPAGDSGVTGRKIIVDTYGGMGRHGGGAFSGKDPSKVDRSATYAARWAAKNVVAAGLAKKCELQIAYVIGKPEPVSLKVDTHGTGKLPDEELAEVVKAVFPWRPGRIIERLHLTGPNKPKYKETARHGHFGKEGFSWERLDMVDKLRSEAKL